MNSITYINGLPNLALPENTMTLLSHSFKVHHLILAAALTTGLSFVNHANAQTHTAFLVDLNSRTAVDLGTLGGWWSLANGINDAGQVVGYSLTADRNTHAFITGPDGVGMRDLGTLGGGWSEARGINDAGQVAGYSYTADGNSHAFITGPDGVGMRDLGTLGGSGSYAFGINDAGQVAGYSLTADGNSHPFITGPDGMGMRDLGSLSGDRRAYDINNAGQVVGSSFITGPDGMGMRGLGSLGGSGGSVAFGINDAGQVVGGSSTSEGFSHAFITGPDGVGMKDLGTLGGRYSYSVASGINDAGQVVGDSYTADGNLHVFITGPDGVGMRDLNSLVDLPPGVTLVRGIDINNSGQVIANATIIPEPEAYALLLAGLGLVGFMARRKKMENLKRY
ncbi:PEP-CTERM protein-sorting domain-containing protein [Nitrosospira multiformis]|uniref:PEP-CTERM protein-sorting domain-containing protein n=2 Tax=Nitrosospira multiformis TaxID=1231 RepID=A0A1H8PIP5_9PROT|nr:PEP-CTERM protein-sorting domain-containing protein [Nitrosospira multiformis]